MFPEETLHCVEWARDKFGKMFSQMPTSAIKILDQGKDITAASSQDIANLKEGVKLLTSTTLLFFLTPCSKNA